RSSSIGRCGDDRSAQPSINRIPRKLPDRSRIFWRHVFAPVPHYEVTALTGLAVGAMRLCAPPRHPGEKVTGICGARRRRRRKSMSTTERFIAMSLCMLLCAPMTLARSAQGQQQDAKATNPTSQDVMIIIQEDKVRFTIQKAVEEARLQVSDQTGELVYDSGVITEPELNWPLQNANGEPVKSGLYGYTLTIKAAGDET